MKLLLDGNSLSIDSTYLGSVRPATIFISANAKRRINASRRIIEKWVTRGETVYGVTTGFGEFSNVKISPADIGRLQENLIISHAAGAGEPLPVQIVRAMIILRLNALAKGYSGIRLETMDFLRKLFNAGITPIIPSKGSVGSSGDLAPLAHCALVLLGRGRVCYRDEVMDSAVALRRVGLRPWKLAAKEGLALVNGTQMMTAYGVHAVYEAKQLCTIADIAAAMSTEALLGSDTPFDPRIQDVRPHAGQKIVARHLRRLMADSRLRESHRNDPHRVQDAYSIRCIPQVHGAVRDTVGYAERVVAVEINSATDNPLIFPDTQEHCEGGNFHGEPVAMALDFLSIALSELANISERRIERLVNGALSGLPRFLTREGGLNSGMMIAQYTAASLVSENKVLSHPASTDSIPTSANQEDHNSMGSIAAQKLWQVLRNAQTVIAIELLAAAQGLDFALGKQGSGRAMSAGKGTHAAYRFIRRYIPHLEQDRLLHDDIQTALRIVREGSIMNAVRKSIGTTI